MLKAFAPPITGITRHFPRVTFTSDNGDDLPKAAARKLILQCRDDIHARISHGTLMRLDATGHCPNLSAPAEVVAAIKAYV